MRKNKNLMLALITTLILNACTNGETIPHNQMPIQIVHTDCDESRTLALLFGEILRSRSYQLHVSERSADSIYAMLARGEANIYLDANLPFRQRALWEQYSLQIERAGQVMEVIRSGLIVPTHVHINSLAQIHFNRQRFGKKIYIAEENRQVESLLRQVMKDYGLGFELEYVQRDSIAQIIENTIEMREWKVFYVCQKRELFTHYDLKFLDDPMHSFREDGLQILTSNRFTENYPAIGMVLQRLILEYEQLNEMVTDSKSASFSEDAFAALIEKNMHIISSWLPDGF